MSHGALRLEQQWVSERREGERVRSWIKEREFKIMINWKKFSHDEFSKNRIKNEINLRWMLQNVQVMLLPFRTPQQFNSGRNDAAFYHFLSPWTEWNEWTNFKRSFSNRTGLDLRHKNSNKICIVKSSRDLCQDDGSHLLWRATIDSSRTWTSPVLGAPPAHTADKMRGVKWPIHCNLCNNKSDTKKKRTPPSLLLFGYYPPQRPLSRR